MKVTLVMVSTINGKITKGEDQNIYNWTSLEDQSFFYDLLSKYKLTIMGSKTFDAVKENLRFDTDRLRVVLTKNPEKYVGMERGGVLEFSSLAPQELLESLGERGYEDILLVGGGEINAVFLEGNLIDEIYVTLEPAVFGVGKSIFSEKNFFADLDLIEFKQLNKKGTLLLHYKVLR